jgi:hypothetical protein
MCTWGRAAGGTETRIDYSRELRRDVVLESLDEQRAVDLVVDVVTVERVADDALDVDVVVNILEALVEVCGETRVRGEGELGGNDLRCSDRNS